MQAGKYTYARLWNITNEIERETYEFGTADDVIESGSLINLKVQSFPITYSVENSWKFACGQSLNRAAMNLLETYIVASAISVNSR